VACFRVNFTFTHAFKIRAIVVGREEYTNFSTLSNDAYFVSLLCTLLASQGHVTEHNSSYREDRQGHVTEHNSSYRENRHIFYEQFCRFLNNYQMRAKSASSLSECANWLTCQHHRETRVQNAHFVVFGVISEELVAPELVQEFSAF